MPHIAVAWPSSIQCPYMSRIILCEFESPQAALKVDTSPFRRRRLDSELLVS
jgi:hypothetical protein